MLSILLIWSYMFIVIYIYGSVILKYICNLKMFSDKNKSLDRGVFNSILCGFAFMTIYAGFFSIFHAVDITAHIILAAGIVFFIILEKKNFFKIFSELKEEIISKKYFFAAVVFLILIYAYGSSFGQSHYDTGLYHAQSVRWIEEFGCVKGIANLHLRLAYNSSAFIITALFSFFYITGQSFHAVSGFLALMLAVDCIKLFSDIRSKRINTAFFLRIMAVYYLAVIFDEMVSPASDYFLVILGFIIFIKWAELLEKDENSFFPYGLLCVLALLNVSMKLSASMLALLALKPLIMIINEKKYKIKRVIFFAVLCVLAVLPYLIRNVIISGWLIYPVSALDFFNVDWKVPVSELLYDSREIRAYGRGYTDLSALDLSFTEWIPHWFSSLDTVSKLFFVFSVFTVLITFVEVIYLLSGLFTRRTVRKGYKDISFLHFQLTALISFMFWLFSAPLVRYGCVYMYFLCCIFAGRLVKNAFAHKKIKEPIQRIIAISTLVFVCYKLFALAKEQAVMYPFKEGDCSRLLLQQDYEKYEMKYFEENGIRFYYPESGDRAGYDKFPALAIKKKIIMRKKGDLKEGFLPAE